MPQNGYATLLGLRGDLAFDFIDSAALVDNGLGDSARKPVIVYTPPDYDAQGSARYPVLYVLHGYAGDALKLTSGGPWDRNVLQWADGLMRSGKMGRSILVLVDGFTRLGGSQYVDSVQNGAYATYVTRDVVAHVDANFRTIASEGGRAVLGKSSGGFGAVHLAMDHPGVFCAFASHSGDAYFRNVFLPSFAPAQRVLERFSFDLPAFVEAFESKRKRGATEFDAMLVLGMAAAYSPRSSAPFDLDLPFDRRTGETNDEVFARWLAFDPVERVRERAKELGRLRLRYLDCGRRDEYSLDIGTRVLAQRMHEAGLEVQHEEFDDDHRNVAYRYEVSLPALRAVLDERS